jgi:hypothetical protein
MGYSVLTQSDLLEQAPDDGSSHAERLAAALDAMDDRGYTFVTVDRPQHDEACFIFKGKESPRRLGNVR